MKTGSKISQALLGQPMFQIKDLASKLEETGKTVYHLELGDPDFDSPAAAIKAATSALNAQETHYTSSWGNHDFREIVMTHRLNSDGYDVDLDQVVILPGANSGIYWTIRVLVNPGEEVLIPDPGFPSFVAATRAAGAEPVTYNLDYQNGYQPSIDKVRDLITKNTRLLILNSPSNPIGIQIDRAILKEIYDLCAHKGVYILSDDTYKRMLFYSAEADSNTVFDPRLNNSFVLGSLSKEFSMSGFRLGYLSGPPNIIEKIKLYIETVNSCVPAFTQAAGREAILNCESIRLENVQKLSHRAEAFSSKLAASTRIELTRPSGGLYVFPRIVGLDFSSVEIAQVLLNDLNIACVPGVYFGRNGEGHLRFSLNQSSRTLTNLADQIIHRIERL